MKQQLKTLRQEYIVSFTDIHRIGKDAIIISSESAPFPLPDDLRGIGWKMLKGLKVMTFSGEELGELSDLIVALSNGEVSSLILAEGKILEIKLDDLTIGADALMVPVGYAARIQELPKKTALECGADAFFEKGTSIDDISGAINTLLGF